MSPVGFIYPEIHGQAAPGIIWLPFIREAVSVHYAGKFFRVASSGSADLVVRQDENAPRITNVEVMDAGIAGGSNRLPFGG